MLWLYCNICTPGYPHTCLVCVCVCFMLLVERPLHRQHKMLTKERWKKNEMPFFLSPLKCLILFWYLCALFACRIPCACYSCMHVRVSSPDLWQWCDLSAQLLAAWAPPLPMLCQDEIWVFIGGPAGSPAPTLCCIKRVFLSVIYRECWTLLSVCEHY